MDNSNDPNSPYSTPPVPGATPTSPPDLNPAYPQTTTPVPSWPNQPVDSSAPINPLSQTPSSYPPIPQPDTFSAPSPAPSWPPITQTSPWSPPQQPFTPPSQPTSTFTAPVIPESPAATTSPMDNPWGVPTPTPTPEPPPVPQAPSQPSWMETSAPMEHQAESAPTDLSQLIAGNGAAPAEPNTLPSTTPETLVVSESNAEAPQVPSLPSEGHKGIPKWLIGVGAALLLIVTGTSAYFILGIGQPSRTTTSVPAITQQTTVRPPAPIATPVPQATPPSATDSANFGQLEGSTQASQATSAADLIRLRQQQGR